MSNRSESEFGNEYRQEPPNCIQIEPVEGCNLRCSYCGIQGIREKGPIGQLSGPFKYMSIEHAARLAMRIQEARRDHKWNPRLELAMHGEPTLHPKLPEIVRLLRHYNPTTSILLTTNGLPLMEGSFHNNVMRLFRAGVNTIALDDYRPHRVRESWLNFSGSKVVKYRYPEQKHGNPHLRRLNGQAFVLVQDIAQADDGNHSHISNHAGCGAPKSGAMQGQRCALPFREMSVRFDGTIAVCCNDWRGIFKLGSIDTATLPELWHHPAMYAIRKKLYYGRREDGPCDGCTHRSYRVGLLPDKLGKRDLPRADDDDQQLIDEACEGATLTPVVLRPYERTA